MRRTEILMNGEWVLIEFMFLTEGNIFRLLDRDNIPMINQKGHGQWIAAGKPYLNEDRVPTIQVYAG